MAFEKWSSKSEIHGREKEQVMLTWVFVEASGLQTNQLAKNNLYCDYALERDAFGWTFSNRSVTRGELTIGQGGKDYQGQRHSAKLCRQELPVFVFDLLKNQCTTSPRPLDPGGESQTSLNSNNT